LSRYRRYEGSAIGIHESIFGDPDDSGVRVPATHKTEQAYYELSRNTYVVIVMLSTLLPIYRGAIGLSVEHNVRVAGKRS
jgi:hypothetical protein